MAYTTVTGTTFEYAKYSGTTLGSYSSVAGLETLPDLGADRAMVETTTMSDTIRTFLPGLKETGGALEYGFIYETGSQNTNFRALKDLESEPKVGIRVTLPDSTKITYDAAVNVKINAMNIGEAVKFTCGTYIQSDMSIS